MDLLLYRHYQPVLSAQVYAEVFAKWNYLVWAALDGGTQVCLFLQTFAVDGGSGIERCSRLDGGIIGIMLIGVCTILLTTEGKAQYLAGSRRLVGRSNNFSVFAKYPATPFRQQRRLCHFVRTACRCMKRAQEHENQVCLGTNEQRSDIIIPALAINIS